MCPFSLRPGATSQTAQVVSPPGSEEVHQRHCRHPRVCNFRFWVGTVVLTYFRLHVCTGKSTTISMLTGQLGATSGDAVVWGQSVRDNLHQVMFPLFSLSLALSHLHFLAAIPTARRVFCAAVHKHHDACLRCLPRLVDLRRTVSATKKHDLFVGCRSQLRRQYIFDPRRRLLVRTDPRKDRTARFIR